MHTPAIGSVDALSHKHTGQPGRRELFLRAARCEPVSRVPVWIMRQAGRYLPEYQAVRARHSFLEICKTPELAAEVSLQPVRALGVDAAIVFSDILIVAEAMGLPLRVDDDGPILSHPVREAAGLNGLREFDPERETRFVCDAIRAIRRAADADLPVIGFAGAPWTLACYMVEGRTAGDVSHPKAMLREQPDIMRQLLSRIAAVTAPYLLAQIAAGADVVQLFDTWACELDAREYEEFGLPATQVIFDALGDTAPRILFARGAARHLETMASSGADVLSIDSQLDLAEARERLDAVSGGGRVIALQGNTDPSILLGEPAAIRAAARETVRKGGGAGHILNLGHGILPNTPVENARAFVEAGQQGLA